MILVHSALGSRTPRSKYTLRPGWTHRGETRIEKEVNSYLLILTALGLASIIIATTSLDVVASVIRSDVPTYNNNFTMAMKGASWVRATQVTLHVHVFILWHWSTHIRQGVVCWLLVASSFKTSRKVIYFVCLCNPGAHECPWVSYGAL